MVEEAKDEEEVLKRRSEHERDLSRRAMEIIANTIANWCVIGDPKTRMYCANGILHDLHQIGIELKDTRVKPCENCNSTGWVGVPKYALRCADCGGTGMQRLDK